MIRNTCTFCSGHLPLQGMGVDFNTGDDELGVFFVLLVRHRGGACFSNVFNLSESNSTQVSKSRQDRKQTTQSGSSYDIVIQLLQIVTAKTCNCVRQHIHNALCQLPAISSWDKDKVGLEKCCTVTKRSLDQDTCTAKVGSTLGRIRGRKRAFTKSELGNIAIGRNCPHCI